MWFYWWMFSFCCRVFVEKSINTSWTRNRVMCYTVKKIWPEASVLLCRFHALKASVLSSSKWRSHRIKGSSHTVPTIYAQTQSEYDNMRNGLASVAPHIFMDYFTKNLDSCPEIGAFHAMKNLVQYNTSTNNFLESCRNKLKATLKPSMSVSDCLKEIVKFQLSQDLDNVEAAMRNSMKSHYFVGECEKQKIRNILTLLTACNVIRQLKLAKKISACCTTAMDEDVIVAVCGESYQIANFPARPSCPCSFSKSQQLPCLHSMIAALNFGPPIFLEEWIPLMWKVYLASRSATKVTCSEHQVLSTCHIAQGQDWSLQGVASPPQSLPTPHLMWLAQNV